MIKLTIGDLVVGKLDDCKGLGEHEIYIFRDGDTVLYVGKSVSIAARLREHVGLVGRFGVRDDTLSKLVQHKLPGSVKWEIELLTIDDCRAYVEVPEDIEARLPWNYVKVIEARMIEALSPILNVAHNSSMNVEAAKKYRYIPKDLIEAHDDMFDETTS